MVNNQPVVDHCVECLRLHDPALTSGRARDAHARLVSTLAALPPGVERLVRALHYLAGISIGRTPKTGPLRFEPILVDFYPELAYVCPDFWPGGSSTVDLLNPPWNSLAVASWFLSRIAHTGKPPNAQLKGWISTGNWVHGTHATVAPPLHVWRLAEGSMTHIREVKRSETADRRCDAYIVVEDGRVMRTFDEPCVLSARGLVAMGVLLWGQPLRPWDEHA